jgi:hypothetical protein
MRNYINFLLSKAGEKLFTKKDSSFDFECKDVNCPHCLEDIRQIVEDEEEDYVNNLKTNNMINFLTWLKDNHWYACDKGWYTTKERPYVKRDARKYYTNEELMEKFKTEK